MSTLLQLSYRGNLVSLWQFIYFKVLLSPIKVNINILVVQTAIYSIFLDMHNPKNNPFKIPLDNDIFTLREKERDKKQQVNLY